MYKTHCQCILDTAINANFDEVGNWGHVTQLPWKLVFVFKEALHSLKQSNAKPEAAVIQLAPLFPRFPLWGSLGYPVHRSFSRHISCSFSFLCDFKIRFW